MQEEKREHPEVKSKLHPRNKNRERYNFKKLIDCFPVLSEFVHLNKYNDESINFSDPLAVISLNKAILKFNYQLDYWDIPEGYLCPPIPGRADYIHHIADLLAKSNDGVIPKGNSIKCVDIGVGANCIYPIIGNSEYGWSFVGSDIDSDAIDSATKIIESNDQLNNHVDLKLQKNHEDFFYGVIRKEDKIDLSLCNPPFHASAREAWESTQRKANNLNKKHVKNVKLNFGGKNTELWYSGGERRFVRNMINQSKKFSASCFWFTTLISKQSNLNGVHKFLKDLEATEVETIPMGQGNKISRIVAWTFQSKEEQKIWADTKWQKQ